MNYKLKYYIYRFSIDFIIMVLFLFIYKKGYCNYLFLERALIIMSLMLLYKWVAIKIGLDFYYHNKDNSFKDDPILKYIRIDLECCNENKRRLNIRIRKFLNSNLCKKYPIILDILFWMFRLMPWNIYGLLLLRIGVMVFNLTIWINSNKDIYYKKREVDKTKKDWSLLRYKSWIYIKWILIYPLLRLLLIPKRIRKRIFMYQSIIDLIRVRFVAYIYSIMYITIGYYDYIKEINWGYKLLMLYIILAVLWPLYVKYLDIRGMNEKVEQEYEFVRPTFFELTKIEKTSITQYLFSLYMEQIFIEKNGYIQKKYKVVGGNGYGEIVCMLFVWKLSIYAKQVYPNIELKWKYEKLYGISYIIYINLLSSYVSTHLDWNLTIYEKGEKELGKEYMEKKYKIVLKKLEELYKCRQLLLMDMRRLMGFKKEEWIVQPKAELKLYSEEEIDYFLGVIKELDSNSFYKVVPKNYIFSFELYNRLFYLGMHLKIWKREIDALDLKFGENKEYVMLDIMKKKKKMEKLNINDIYEEEKVRKFFYYYELHILQPVYEVREERGEDIYNYKYFEDICKEVEDVYFKEYENIKDPYSLISEKYILAFKEKYIR